ncbi:MAG TPA: GntR family transcriptional regulator [Actinomycetes bacterium]|nr:GntR family transcriptional regulator [Actinomycetes bacterium]
MTVPDPAQPALGAASERIAAHLRAAILSGDIGPGERIRQEEVADRLGTSRLPVREALRILEAEGLTELEANKGARVPRLDAAELDVLYKMRERLEPLALAESIPHLSSAEVRALSAIHERIAADADLRDFMVLDREFHLGSYAGCPSEQLAGTATRLWNSTQAYRRAFMSLGGRHRLWIVDHEHRLILDAIERRDTDDAERYLAGHIRRTRIELAAHPELFR